MVNWCRYWCSEWVEFGGVEPLHLMEMKLDHLRIDYDELELVVNFVDCFVRDLDCFLASEVEMLDL